MKKKKKKKTKKKKNKNKNKKKAASTYTSGFCPAMKAMTPVKTPRVLGARVMV